MRGKIWAGLGPKKGIMSQEVKTAVGPKKGQNVIEVKPHLFKITSSQTIGTRSTSLNFSNPPTNGILGCLNESRIAK